MITFDTVYSVTPQGTKLVCQGREQDVAANIHLVTVGDRKKMIAACKAKIAECKKTIQEQQDKKKHSKNSNEIVNCNKIIAACKQIIKNNQQMIVRRQAEIDQKTSLSPKMREFYAEQDRIKAALATTGNQKTKGK